MENAMDLSLRFALKAKTKHLFVNSRYVSNIPGSKGKVREEQPQGAVRRGGHTPPTPQQHNQLLYCALLLW